MTVSARAAACVSVRACEWLNGNGYVQMAACDYVRVRALARASAQRLPISLFTYPNTWLPCHSPILKRVYILSFLLSFFLSLFPSLLSVSSPSADSIHMMVVVSEIESGANSDTSLAERTPFHPFLGRNPVGIFGNWSPPHKMFAIENIDAAHVAFEQRFWLSLRQLCYSFDSSNLPISHRYFTLMTSPMEREKLLELREINKKRPFSFATEYVDLMRHFVYVKEKS